MTKQEEGKLRSKFTRWPLSWIWAFHDSVYTLGPHAGKSDTWLQIFQNDSKICEAEVTVTPLINKICIPWLHDHIFQHFYKWACAVQPWTCLFNTSLVLSSLCLPVCIVFLPISIKSLVPQQNCPISRAVFCGKATSKLAWAFRTIMMEM